MIRPVNIFSKDVIVNLDERRYRIYALGGFRVKLNDFKISFINRATAEEVRSRKAFWPVQTYSYNRRAKRIFILDVPEKGAYEIKFHEPNSIRMKRSNLSMLNMFQYSVPNRDIDILITDSLGFNLFID